MNLVFNIARTYEHEFTSNNLIKSDMVIDRISMKGNEIGTCLVLDRVNNMQERRQSPLAVLNEAYTENAHMNVVVPKSRKWSFSLTDKTGATIIPALIQMAPQIISSLKSLISGKEGGALKFGGASAVFLNGINLGDYDDVLKTMKAIERQSKNIEVRGGALYAGSSRVGTFFKNAWNKIKGWYDNNADKLKPITDILVNAGTNAANNAINKGLNYVNQKTGSDTVKQLANVIGDMAKGTVSDVANQIQGKDAKASGAGYDISDLDNETQAIEVQTKKKNRILTALPQNENKMHESVIRRRVY